MQVMQSARGEEEWLGPGEERRKQRSHQPGVMYSQLLAIRTCTSATLAVTFSLDSPYGFWGIANLFRVCNINKQCLFESAVLLSSSVGHYFRARLTTISSAGSWRSLSTSLWTPHFMRLRVYACVEKVEYFTFQANELRAQERLECDQLS